MARYGGARTRVHLRRWEILYIEKERKREREKEKEKEIYICVCQYPEKKTEEKILSDRK